MDPKYRRLKWACYSTNVSMSVVASLSPLLFLTFRNMYGISYSLLGLLVLINFVTQLGMDLAFSFFSHRFPIPKVVKMTPALTVLGLAVYALWPFFFPDAVYAGLVVGTVIFSAAAGFNEVLISPVIASIPAEDPDREMSKLHSTYAWGVVAVIVAATAFLQVFGAENWQYLTLLFTLIPATGFILFAGARIPDMETPERASGALRLLGNPGLRLCIAAIFLGGAAECTMAQWSSSYLEQALGIPKVWGDVCGVALFSVMLGLGRTLYARCGKNITRILFAGGVGASACYLVAALSSHPVPGLLACALTGLCVSMLWPGSLIVASDRFPAGGVFVFAVMAAGGDMGASLGSQLVGVVTDAVIALPAAATVAQNMALTVEQLGMKLGMLVGMIFPVLAVAVYWRIMHGAMKETVHG